MSSSDLQTLEKQARLELTPIAGLDEVSTTLHEEAGGCTGDPDSSNDSVRLLRYLDKVADHLDPSSAISRKFLSVLREICGNRMVLLAPCRLPRQNPCTVGPVYPLRYKDDHVTAMKKLICKEAVTLKRLEHPNIVPIIGFDLDAFQFAVDRRPDEVDLMEYIQESPNANLIALLSDVARGLQYLHSRDVVDQVIRGSNVFVGRDGRARFADCGLATIKSFYKRQLCPENGFQWVIPGVQGGDETYSKESNIFFFGMLMVEVFTGEQQFPGLSVFQFEQDINILRESPARPTHPAVIDPVWELMERCWSEDPRARPTAMQVLESIINLTSQPERPATAEALSAELLQQSSNSENLSRPNAVKVVEVLESVVSGDDEAATVHRED